MNIRLNTRHRTTLYRLAHIFFTLFVCLSTWALVDPAPAAAQDASGENATDEQAPLVEEALPAPDRVDVEPLAKDEEIAERLVTILQATEWFQTPTASVREGVVFLEGSTSRDAYKEWAGELARNTQDVVAVVNRIDVVQPLNWDVTPAVDELRNLGRDLLVSLPLLILGAIILVVAWFVARFAGSLAKSVFHRRVASPLLRNVLAMAIISVPIFLLGLYLVLQILGLTRLALTVLGGTGLAGLIVGIAFRDILENFLASILISTRTPFRAGDKILVQDYLGIVQQVTTRATILMTLEGNQAQIPNATIYKSDIVNYTVNPRLRLDFMIGIGYDDAISAAQALIRDTLQRHPALLADPEPSIVVDNLGASSVNLRIFFWIDGNEHDALKVKSAVIRLVKRALEDAHFTMPDEAREVIFPQGVPIQLAEALSPSSTDRGDGNGANHSPVPKAQGASQPEPFSIAAEGSLNSADQQIREQARHTPSPEGGENLLDSD